MITPFADQADAQYWGGGLCVPAAGGGWWSLHARTTPAGVEIWCVGADGWRDGLAPGYVWANPDDGGPSCICAVTERGAL